MTPINTLVISMSATFGLVGVVMAQPVQTTKITTQAPVVAPLQLEVDYDMQDAIRLEQLSYEESQKPVINTSGLNEHELRIFNQCQSMGMTLEQTAFVLANTRHETGQYKYLKEIDGPNQAIRLGYKGGSNWYGRGYIQLTHDTNYSQWSKWTGVDLIANPDLLVTDLELSAKIACSGIKYGSFTAKPPIEHYINDSKQDYFNARELVNGDKWSVGNKIAGYTEEYIQRLKG